MTNLTMTTDYSEMLHIDVYFLIYILYIKLYVSLRGVYVSLRGLYVEYVKCHEEISPDTVSAGSEDRNGCPIN